MIFGMTMHINPRWEPCGGGPGDLEPVRLEISGEERAEALVDRRVLGDAAGLLGVGPLDWLLVGVLVAAPDGLAPS